MDKKDNIIYRRIGDGYVTHNARLFDKKLSVGKAVTLQYETIVFATSGDK
ncbi:KfrB domain-containing protein [Nitrosomonas aestuarii]